MTFNQDDAGSSPVGGTKTCNRCGETKPLGEFAIKRNGRQGWCKPCNRVYQRNHYKLNAQAYKDKAKAYESAYAETVIPLVLAYLEAHPCVDCGNTDIRVMHFDHRDPELKELNISQALHNSWAWERLNAEIAKCDVRCSNCHMIRTAEQFGWWRHFVT